MNYLSHAMAFLDEPLTMAGSVTPDLLSVVDRRCRLRLKKVEPAIAAIRRDASDSGRNGLSNSAVELVLLGFQAHLVDDHWFHGSAAFLDVTAKMSRRFREAMPEDESHRVGFLGHIVVELLLDRWIMDKHDAALDEFYSSFATVDPQVVQYSACLVSSRPTDKLVPFWHRFIDERFLYDYQDSKLLLRRINQVLKRVRLPALEPKIIEVLEAGYDDVRKRAVDLLPSRVVASVLGTSGSRDAT